MDAVPSAPQNRLLASVPPADFRLLEPHLEDVQLGYKRLLYQANQPIAHVYFFKTGVGSLVHTMRKGAASEVGAILAARGLWDYPCCSGMIGLPTVSTCKFPGVGLRMKSEHFTAAVEQSKSLRQALLHYAHAFFNQVAQSAACAHHHLLEQRCCRWLLMTYDRMDSNQFKLTQEFLAMMLGVRRAGVTVAASALQRAGLIRYTRGDITILDPDGLKKRSCECYEISKQEFDRLLGFESANRQSVNVNWSGRAVK